MKLSEPQQDFLRLFPCTALNDDLFPLSGHQVDAFKFTMNTVYALIRKGLIVERNTGMWSLTDEGEAVLREIDPGWAEERDDPHSNRRTRE